MNQNTSPIAQTDQARHRKRHSAERWRKLLEDQQASGLPISTFCRERGIPASSLFAWRRRFGLGAGRRSPEGVEVFKPVTITAKPRSHRQRRGQDETEPAAASFIELCLAGQRRLIVRRGFDRQLLQDVVDALEPQS